jgi:hypothetical protein
VLRFQVFAGGAVHVYGAVIAQEPELARADARLLKQNRLWIKKEYARRTKRLRRARNVPSQPSTWLVSPSALPQRRCVRLGKAAWYAGRRGSPWLNASATLAAVLPSFNTGQNTTAPCRKPACQRCSAATRVRSLLFLMFSALRRCLSCPHLFDGTNTQAIPAACAASTPSGLSSNTRQSAAATFSRLAASRNGSGNGLPRS